MIGINADTRSDIPGVTTYRTWIIPRCPPKHPVITSLVPTTQSRQPLSEAASIPWPQGLLTANIELYLEVIVPRHLGSTTDVWATVLPFQRCIGNQAVGIGASWLILPSGHMQHAPSTSPCRRSGTHGRAWLPIQAVGASKVKTDYIRYKRTLETWNSRVV